MAERNWEGRTGNGKEFFYHGLAGANFIVHFAASGGFNKGANQK